MPNSTPPADPGEIAWIIDQLLEEAGRAAAVEGPAGINARRQCLMAAAALKMKFMATDADEASEVALDDWLATYGPKS